MNRARPLVAGDRVQLSDPKGRLHTVVLSPGSVFHTHHGTIAHDDLLGGPEGVVVHSTGGIAYLALRPLLRDTVLAMPRGATVVYPKDAAMIVGYADIAPGAVVVEAGAGSGALTCSLLRAVGPHGRVVSYERREEFAALARANVERVFGGPPPQWELRIGDVGDLGSRTAAAPESAGDPDGSSGDRDPAVDRVVLDLLAPWEVVPGAAAALIPGGVICCYVATTSQLSRVVEELRAHGGFSEPESFETLLRAWHVEGLAVRPGHRMIGHTGFLVTSRRLAPGVTAPPRRRRPAKGSSVPGLSGEILELSEAGAEGWWAPESRWLGRWLLRAGSGFTRRANSALPLGDPGRDLTEALGEVERFYRDRGLVPTIVVPHALAGPHADPLDRWLAAHGWGVDGAAARVLTAEAAATAAGSTEADAVALAEEPDAAWLATYHYRGEPLPAVGRTLLTSARWQAFATVRRDGATIAIGRVAGGLRWAGVTAVEVVPDRRRQGWGRTVVAALAGEAVRRGAARLYLQVGEENLGARALYRATGWRDHHRYHYRVAPRPAGEG